MSDAVIILGDQLFPHTFYTQYKKLPVFMAEDFELATHFKYHKHKIAFFFISMRTYSEELTRHGFQVHYEKLSSVNFMENLANFVKKNQIKKLIVPEVQDKFFEKSLLDFSKEQSVTIDFITSPMFLCSRQEFKNYLAKYSKPFMKTFYEGERKRLNVLMAKNQKPEGEQWSFDVENRKKAPKELTNKKLLKPTPNIHFDDVKELVNKNFSSHPGNMDDFWLPTSREESLKFLEHFINHHLDNFGDYQDAITSRDPFLYHSVISPMMNNGFITPDEIIQRVIKAYRTKKDIPLASVEGFIRQIMGWREFVRGIYQNYSEKEESSNFFNHQNKLGPAWYEGTTGILPVDDAIKKAIRYGYCHHIERLMILSNIMLLTEIHPQEVHKWFMEMFVDSADWVMGPNVYGMGQFADGGLFATKPYISGSNYILKMSDYKKGDWCEIWDGLFWRFIDKNSKFFLRNPRMSMMVKTFEKMDNKKKLRMSEVAEKFIQQMC
ncbi:MAG: cryptochrome/photolyase family protein [Bacteriovoracaceae bacterium]|nr:cryptochrome/photolyase family protein [Bacteriovoracaceae bacterium]